MSRSPHVFMVAGEESGDQLGAGLMRALSARLPGATFAGLGGQAMAREGLATLFPLSEVSVMGLTAVLARLPAIYRRGLEVVEAAVAARPDVLVIIDSPEFTHAVAKRVRRRLPDLPVVDYVSPSVWAWRSGRARRMRAYVDHVLALKPFEPAVHLRLGGPPCTYVGHPLVEQLNRLRPAPGERQPLGRDPFTLLVLPGSRRSEVSRLIGPFGEAVGRLVRRSGREVEVVIPAVAHLAAEIRTHAASWPRPPTIVEGEAAKHAAMRRANAALAASGTVTLELALAGIPTVVAYKVSRPEWPLRHLVKVPSIVLANLILGENAMPELLQGDATPDKLAAALGQLMADTPERRRQVDAFGRLDGIMEVGADTTPSERAAEVVVRAMGAPRSAIIPGLAEREPGIHGC